MSIKIRLTIAIILMFSLLLGCTKKDQTVEGAANKEQLIVALEQQAEMNNYRFTGQANLNIDWPAFSGKPQQPLTAGLTQMLTNGSMQWHGVSDHLTGRLELDLQLEPHALQTTIDIPVLINHNKLYIQIPLLAATEDEFLSFDLNQQISGWPISTWLTEMINTLDESYFVSFDREDAANTTIGINVTQDNYNELSDALQSSLPSLIHELVDGDMLNNQQAERWNEELTQMDGRFKITTIDQPGYINFGINEDGWIVNIQIALYFDNQVIEIEQAFTDLNDASESFSKQIPEHVRPLEAMIEQFR